MADERQFVGPYELVDVIGKGAQASIYRAIYTGEDRPGLVNGQVVALKRMVVDDQYFDRQGDFGVELKHKNIVQYLDHFREDGFEERPCIVMEYLEGYTLEDAINESVAKGGLDWDVVRHIFFQCMEGFVFAYSQGVVHRDVKPSNIFITEEGDVKLIDFGVVRRIDGQSTVGGFRGTLDYMSPDFVTVNGFTGDEQSDVFSLGICFFESLIGALPFKKLGANAEFEFMGRWSDSPNVKFSTSRWIKKNKRSKRVNARKLDHIRVVLDGLSPFIKRCLTADRGERFTSFAQMQRALGRIEYKRVKSTKNDYQLTDVLGVGGFGRVYKARQSNDYSKEFAIKELLNSKDAMRFEREAELLLRYPHPHIVRCMETFEVDRQGDLSMYLVMECLAGMPGSSLRDRIRQGLKASDGQSAMEVNEALLCFTHLLEGLEHLHQNGVLHRDLKPANLYTPENQPEAAKLLDLGIARDAGSTMTKSGAPGTLDYMAPEFATETDFKGSAGSDVYALGLALYESIAGSPVFPRLSRSSEAPEVAFYKRATSPQRAELEHEALRNHPGVIRIIRRAIQADPGKRYQSAADMLDDINAWLGGDDSATLVDVSMTDVTQADMTLAAPVVPPSDPAASPPLPPAPSPRKQTAAPQPPPAAPRSGVSAPTRAQQPVARKNDPPRENVFNQPRKKKSPGGAFFGFLFGLLVVAGLAVGGYYVFVVLPKASRVDCAELQQTAEEGLVQIEALLRLDEAMLQSLVRLQETLNEGARACPGDTWVPYFQRLSIPMKAFPGELGQSIVQSIIRTNLAQASTQLDLLGKVGTRYGSPPDFGLSPAELTNRVETLQASLAYGEAIQSLRDRERNLPLRNISDVKAANEAYKDLVAFTERDWDQVDQHIRRLDESLEADGRSFLATLPAAFSAYLAALEQQGKQANRSGESVRELHAQVQDPALVSSPVLKVFPDLEKQRASLATTLQVYLNPQTREAAAELAGLLADASTPALQVIRDLGKAATLDVSTLPDVEKGAFDAAVAKAVSRVSVLLESQKDNVIARYAANDCEGGETEYQKMQAFKDALPKGFFDQALTRVERQLGEARERCQAYIADLATFHARIKPLQSESYGTLKGIDQTISSIGEMASAYAYAAAKNLDVSRDAQRTGERLTRLLHEARAQDGAGRQAALFKAETLMAGLKARQKELGTVMSLEAVKREESLIEKELASYLLHVTNGGTVLAMIQLNGQAEQSLAVGNSLLLTVPVRAGGTAETLRVAAAVPGAVPERKEFTPTRGGYGEMTVVPKMPTEASVHLALNPQGDELQVSAQLIRPGKAPEAWPADLTLKPGMYEAFFRRPDYKDILLPFTVPQGQQTITLKGPVITDWKNGPELQRLLELRKLQRDDPVAFAGQPLAAFNLDIKDTANRTRLDDLRLKWDQSRKNVWEGPIARAELDINSLREGLFQVSAFGGVQVQSSLRRYEDASESPVMQSLKVPGFSKSAALPLLMRKRLERINFWAAALKRGHIDADSRTDLAHSLHTLEEQAGSDFPALTEELLMDQWVLSGTFRTLPAGKYSEELQRRANRLIAHTDYLYPADYAGKVNAIAAFMENSDAFNHFDALLAIYVAFNHFYHSAFGLPSAVVAEIRQNPAQATEIRAANQVVAARLSTCLDRLSAAQVALVVEHISHDEANRIVLFTILDRIGDRDHPIRDSVTPWLRNKKEVGGIQKSLKEWHIHAGSPP